ncbi:MAG: hypothetical protein LWY06_10835 [Firmicutes bacterium]|nr:hypothetical protein [Bacillota bacterium]
MKTQEEVMACFTCGKEIHTEDSYFVVDDNHYCWKCGFERMNQDYNTKFDSMVYIHSGRIKDEEIDQLNDYVEF